MLDPAQLDQSLDTLTTVAQALVQQHAQAARSLANDYYQSIRAASGITEAFKPIATPLPDPAKVAQYIKWATGPLTAPQTPATPQLTAASPEAPTVPAAHPEAPSAPSSADLQLAVSKAAAVLEKLVTDTSRQQVIDNVQNDRRATGWAREARPDACWFCAMLATRGAVYHSAAAAGLDVVDGLPMNTYHTHCKCQVVPTFGAYEPPAHVRQWQNLWDKSTADQHGADKAWAFQEAYEGRKIERRTDSWSGYVPKNRVGSGRARKPKSHDQQVDIAAGMSDARAQQALDRARELYQQEGDPVGDRVAWVRVLEDRLGQPHAELKSAFDTDISKLSDADLQKAITNVNNWFAANPNAPSNVVAKMQAKARALMAERANRPS